jgi:hypothetical protein
LLAIKSPHYSAKAIIAKGHGGVRREIRFEHGEHKRHYQAEDFLMSFSLPNFLFHATTAYDILRWKGLPIGKRHYLGKMRSRPAK